MGYIEKLKDAIKRLHGCKATYLETVPVTELFHGQIVWHGDVEVFDIKGHSQAKRCYAWAHETDNKAKRYVAVLELPPVDSPQKAVKAAVIGEFKARDERQKKSKGR